MPHCVLEYSANVLDRPDLRRLLLEIHDVIMKTGEFSLGDIKSRVLRHDVFVVGDGSPDRAFVTLDIQILGGRSDEMKARLSEGALHVLERAYPTTLEKRKCSLTVQVSDLHRPSYRRRMTYES